MADHIDAEIVITIVDRVGMVLKTIDTILGGSWDPERGAFVVSFPEGTTDEEIGRWFGGLLRDAIGESV